MKKLRLLTVAGAAYALLCAIPVPAADKPATMPDKPAKAVHSMQMRSTWPAETLSGKIAAVDANRKLLVVKDSNGVPFDMVVTPTTRIRSGDRALTLKDLAQDHDRSISVQFVPERRGDVAESIRING